MKKWVDLNEFLKTSSEDDANKLLKQELKEPRRKQFALRIHSRMNKLRAARERVAIIETCK